ncbi:Putative SOS response-associated peptidase YedK [Marinobacter daqiaonensis]|uniref:Abasic site processing protein n=1 Tax=Marinobacter daqiaonensis TaxID=650891 RepID=A0A1I6H179_9GAMM|nr:SOS response-associated peptidase [Marinobacter daqiaonensis]SFR48077.1 Putative SOS response-associated peptidase YedK [Marinobacter daqiaonensis]
MCGRFNVNDDPLVRDLMEQLGVARRPRPRLNVAPGSAAEVVLDAGEGRQLVEGMWSLLIEPHPDGEGYRPNPRFKTFNARSDRLTSSPLWKRVYPKQRCIVPMSAFHEWRSGQVYNIHPDGEAIAMAGLWQRYRNGDDEVISFTTITLPPHPRFSHIHDKSLPLMLRPEDFDAWLDPDFHQVDAFQGLMRPHIPVPLICEPVNSPKDLKPVGEPERIEAD